MNCPVSRDHPLQPVVLDEKLPAHTCPAGHGTWLSSDTYYAWLERRDQPLPEASGDEEVADVEEPDIAKICPECGHIMLRYRVGHEITFDLDHCGNCNGVWFDANEWEHIRLRNLHDKVHRMFGPGWQRQVWIEQRQQARDELYLQKFGATDYEEIKRIKTWLDDNPHRVMLLAFLNDPDPFKP